MKKCELCRLPARLYCQSDEASLCAGCDLKVHEANFLVARHSRRLLCKRCQRPTPWAACGARLGITVTECDKCAVEEDEEIVGPVDEDEESEGENQMAPVTGDTSSFSSSGCASRSAPSVNRMRDSASVITSRIIIVDNSRSRTARQQFGGDKSK